MRGKGIAVEVTRVRLGPRGEDFRFSATGAVATFGLPARRFSWVRDVAVHPGCVRTEEEPGPEELGSVEDLDAALARGGVRSRVSGAPLPERQVEMLRTLLEGEERRRHAALEVAGLMRQLDSMVSFWRDMPPVPDEEQLARAAEARPFVFREEWPEPSDPAVEREAARRAARSEATRTTPEPASWPAVVTGTLVAAVTGVALAESPRFHPAVALLLGAAAGMAAAAMLLAAWRWVSLGRAARRALERADAAWPAVAERQARAERSAREGWERRRDEAQSAWSAAEAERLERVRRLRAGDDAAAAEAVRAALEDLDFPAETRCHLATEGSHASLVVEMPDVDEVIPPIRAVVSVEFSVEEEQVPPAARNDAHAEYVAGVALLLARTALAAAPGIRTVRVAAHRRTAGGAEGWLLDAEVDRGGAAALDPATVDPRAFLAERPGRFRQGLDRGLSSLPPPAWLGESFGQPPEAPPPAWRN
jgi:hypothetical protein